MKAKKAVGVIKLSSHLHRALKKILGFFSFYFRSFYFSWRFFPEASALMHCSAVAVFLTETLWITGVPFLLSLSDTAKKAESFQMLLHAALFLFFSSLMCFQLCVYVGFLRLF